MNKFMLVRDTREKEGHGWSWPEDNDCQGTITRKIDYGDYSVEGLDFKIFIDRKQNVSEIAKNVIEKRFEKLLENIRDFRYKFLICEFTFEQLSSYPVGSDLPPSLYKRIRIRGGFLQAWLAKITLDYGVNVIFCGDAKKAEKFCYILLKRIHKLES